MSTWRKREIHPKIKSRISTDLNELQATENANEVRYIKAIGVQGIVVKIRCIVVKN